MYKLLLIVLGLLAACANAMETEVEATLRDRIAQSLNAFSEVEAEAEVEVEGVENCPNKCDKVFQRMAYQVAVNGGDTFEYTSCLIGCEKCQANLNAKKKPSPRDCFEHCKNYDWKGNGLLKGVIEPDKACMAGCIINNCQAVCTGGTPKALNKNTKQFYWPNGGCTIKTEPYSQNAEYVPWNSPNSGQGGNVDVAQCCSNALSLCQYVGPTNTQNYQILEQVTGNMCETWVPSKDKNEICAFFNNPANCGSI